MSFFTFDENKLLSLDSEEKKQLLLFQWLSVLEINLNKYKNQIKENQKKLLEFLLEKCLLAFPPNSFPKLTQPTRTLVARCLIFIYSNGDSRSLYDTMVAIQNLLLNKKLDDVAVKLAAIHCLGAITEVHGLKALSLFVESVSIMQKTLRYAKDADVAMRYECLQGICRLLRGAGKGASDSLAKELFKLAKQGTYDRLPIIKRVSLELMDAVYQNTVYLPPLNLADYDSTIVSVAKCIDCNIKGLRNAAASTIATLLSLSQNPPPKHAAKKNETPSELPILSVNEMLSLLQLTYIKSTSTESRMTIIEGFGMFFKRSGIEFIENNYADICKTCFDLVSSPKLQDKNNRNDGYIVKEAIRFLLRDVVGMILSESGQLNACRHLARELKKTGASDTELNCIVLELGSLLSDLGPAAYPIQEDVIEGLLIVLTQSPHTIKLNLGSCLRSFCLALPQNITKIMSRLVVAIQRGLPGMTIDKPDSIDQVLGHGYLLCSVIGIIATRPLFAAYEDAATIFGLATQLLKSHTSAKDYRVMSSQAQIGWMLIGSLTSLGPHFVKVHISQLLLIWKNVFPKPQPKDAVMVRGDLEWFYLLHSRESALVALQSFITFNSKEIANVDISKRIFVFLNNTLQFLATLNGAYGPVDDKAPTPLQISLYEKECSLRKRLFECFRLLAPSSIYETIYTPLMRSTVDCFALDPDKPDRFLATLGTREGAFFGAIGGKDTGALVVETIVSTSLATNANIIVANDCGAEDKGILKHSVSDLQLQAIENILQKNPQRVLDNDPHTLYLSSKQVVVQSKNGTETVVLPISIPVCASIGLVDAAIELFSLLFPLQNVQTQETVMEQLIKSATHQGGRVTPIRKAACQLNSLVAVIGALKYIAAKKGQLCSPKVAVAIRDLMIGFVKSPDPLLRSAACEIAGRISRISGNSLFINPMMQDFIDQVINNRDPDVRAGSCLALGSIYHFVGGMAAGSHLQSCVGIFHSLAADPHPHVHTWALHALCLTIESAGLMYGPYVNSTLSLIAKLFMSETHETAAPSANLPGIEGNSEIYPIFGRILNALLGVIGPELQDSSKLRDICLNLFEQLKNDSDPLVVVEAIRCIQNFIMFAPKHVDIPIIIPFLQKQLIVDNKAQVSVIRAAAVTCLYQLTQRDAGSVLEAVVDNCLEEQLFALFDLEKDPAVRDEIKDILIALLRHVGPTCPSRWIDLCKNILSKSITAPAAPEAAPKGQEEQKAAHDDDGEDGEIVVEAPTNTVKNNKTLVVPLLPRWRTQVFSLSCVEMLIQLVLAGKREEDLDLEKARLKRATNSKDSDFLVFKIGDLIKLAFNSSTGSVSYLRMSGLKLLKSIVENYSSVKDPDFAEHRILEQYEAQIISAIAPGFEIDANPEITTAACGVTAFYLCSGLIQEVSPNIRPVKLLSSLLEQFTGKEIVTGGRTPNAQVVIKLAVLSAWAAIYSNINSEFKATLFNLYLQKLFPLWFGVLKDYALLGNDAEEENLLEASGSNSNSIYSTATKDVAYSYYAGSWIGIKSAITTLVEENSQSVVNLFPDMANGATDTEIPSAFFTILGLCCDHLSSPPSSSTRDSIETANFISCIKSIQKLASKRVLGVQFMPDELVNELFSLFDKLVQTEDGSVQSAIIDSLILIATNFEADLSLRQSVDQSKLLRIVFNVLAHYIPGLTANPSVSVNVMKNLLTSDFIAICSKAFDLLKVLLDYECIFEESANLILILSTVILGNAKFSKDLGPKFLMVYRLCLQANQLKSLSLLQSVQFTHIALLEESSQNKEQDPEIVKNTLLAIILSITSYPKLSTHELLQSLSKCCNHLYSTKSTTENQIVCLQSVRACLHLSNRPEPDYALVGSLLTRSLLPNIINEIFKFAELLADDKSFSASIDEGLKLLLIVTLGKTDPYSKYQALVFLISVLVGLIGCISIPFKSRETGQLYSFIGSTMVQIASQNPDFKSIISGLNESQRSLLESCMKHAMAAASNTGGFASFGNTKSQNQEGEKPKIELKMFG